MIRQTSPIHQNPVTTKTSASKNVVEGFKQMFDQVNQDQLQADTKVADLATGRSKDVPGTMIALEKAETSMKLLVAVRNKIVTTYEEMMRMQV